MKYPRSQSLSDLDAEPPRMGVLELYSAHGGIPKETKFLKWSEVTTKGQGLAGRFPAFRGALERHLSKSERVAMCRRSTKHAPVVS
jgi:hypothetical protein